MPYRIAAALFCALLFPHLAAAPSSCGAAEKAKEDAKKSDAKTHTVRRGPLKLSVEIDGVLEAVHMHPVAFTPKQWSDLLVTKAVPQGATVNKGEPLVWLDTQMIDRQIRDLQLAAELGAASLRQAELDAAALEQTGPLQLAAARRAKQAADEDLDYYLKVSRARSIKAAHFSVSNAEQNLENAEEELRQLEKMYKEDDLTEETEEIILKRSRNDVEAARYYLESARLQRDRTLSVLLPRETSG